MKINKKKIVVAAAVIVAVWLLWGKPKSASSPAESVKIINPQIGSIRLTVQTTGTVLPKNRLEIKPPVNGRIEEVLVKEGQAVKTGETVAWMSSTDRAALLDAARGEGEEKLKYWEEVYKPIPLTAPIDGEVIVGITQPGQAVTTADAVIVLSDRLIVRAQVDETDIGKVKEGQNAVANLDAYPEKKINAKVDHVYYESKTVNNVTIYEVDLMPDEVPPFFRSGMSANVEFVQENRENVLMIPVAAVSKEDGGAFVTVKPSRGRKTVRQQVILGISDDKNVEIISGLNEEDSVVLKTRKFSLPRDTGGSNPFMPQRRRN